MAVKYRLVFSNINLEEVVVEISHPDYVGDAIPVIGVGGESYSLSRTAIETPHDSHVIPTTANINLYTDLIDVEELQQANDKEWRVIVSVDGNFDFHGYIVPDGIQKTLKGAGNIVRLSATCGLALLNGIKYSWLGANWGRVYVDGQQSVNLCPMNFIRQLLESPSYAGHSIPIEWYTSIRYDIDPTRDFFAGSMPFSESGSLSELLLKNEVDAYWLLSNMVKAGKCTIVQDRGKWMIINYEDLINNDGVLDVWNIPANVGDVTATLVTRDFNVDLTALSILDDAYTTYKKSVGKVNVTYNHIQNKNIIPNGSFDETLPSGEVAKWKFLDSNELAPSYASLTGQPGYSADIDRRGKTADIYSMQYPMNIDANKLFKYISFGFHLLPLNGFPVDQDGNIIWGLDTLKITVYYQRFNGTTTERLYLNEFGYWTNGIMGGNQVVERTFYSVIVPASFNIEFNDTRNFFVGDQVNITFVRSGVVENRTIVFNETMPVKSGVEYIVGRIQDGSVSNPNDYTISFTNVQDDARNTASVTKSPDYAQDIRLISSSPTQPGYVINFSFQSNAGARAIKLPDPGDLNINSGARGELGVLFHCKTGQRYVIDDFYMNVDDNKEMYELTNGTQNSEESYELGISTSFSGFFLSSFKENPSNAEKFQLMTDYSGSGKRLTELYGRGVLNWRNKARKIYNGTFKADIPYISLVTIGSDKYIPTGMDSNKTNGQLTLQGFQAALDVVSPTVVHKGSNEDNLNK